MQRTTQLPETAAYQQSAMPAMQAPSTPEPRADSKTEATQAPKNGTPAAVDISPGTQLIVSQNNEITAGGSARLQLQLKPATPEANLLLIRNVPEGLRFNYGSRAGSGEWTLPVSNIAELEMSASKEMVPGGFDLALEVRTLDGRNVTSGTLKLVVAPPLAEGQAPAIASLDEAARAQHIAKANEYLAIGQVSAARQVLQRAADGGSPEAAVLLGDTYDPVRLFQLGVRGLIGDTARAADWYEKADQMGSPEAKERIAGLKRR
jgi:hypothetical protein